jgi:hypothetical protein
VWGSEFTSKAAAIQGDPAETAATLNVKLWVLEPACLPGRELPPIEPTPLFESI